VAADRLAQLVIVADACAQNVLGSCILKFK
jgi:hypothetical protein